jgi:hypothetical protein
VEKTFHGHTFAALSLLLHAADKEGIWVQNRSGTSWNGILQLPGPPEWWT